MNSIEKSLLKRLIFIRESLLLVVGVSLAVSCSFFLVVHLIVVSCMVSVSCVW